MARNKRRASGFDESHTFWPKALELWRLGHSNAQVAKEAQEDGFDFTEAQIRYAHRRFWTAAVERAELKVLVDAYVRQGRLLNETNDTITVLHAKLGRLDSASDNGPGSGGHTSAADEEDEPRGASLAV